MITKASLLARLQSADMMVLQKQLHEKEGQDAQSLLVPFSDSQPVEPLRSESASEVAPSVPDAVLLVEQIMNRHAQDAERAFARILPVGSATPEGVNPGLLYQTFRAMENPEHRRREADLLFGQANKTADALSRGSTDFLRELGMQIPRMGDRNKKERAFREQVMRLAGDYPRALIALKSSLTTRHLERDLEGLRATRFFLLRAEPEWTSFVRRMRDTPAHPLDQWCAQLRSMQAMADTIRRGSA